MDDLYQAWPEYMAVLHKRDLIEVDPTSAHAEVVFRLKRTNGLTDQEVKLICRATARRIPPHGEPIPT